MFQFNAISYICIFWTVIYLCDLVLKMSNKYSSRYISILIQNGFIISFGQIRWYTSRFNKYIILIGTSRFLLMRAWFDCGIIFSLLTLFASIFILCKMILNFFFNDSAEEQILTPVMPGVNLPINQLGFYFLTLIVCGVFHELGHAMAAVRESVKVNGFGIFLLLLYPGAFVDVSTDHISAIHPWRQLRIYCAGVWHNLVLVMLAIGAILIMPILFFPLYKTKQGVIVTYLKEDSVVSGLNGLYEMDIILNINKCSISTIIDWSNCLNAMMVLPNQGYCTQLTVSQNNLKNNIFKTEKDVWDCCLNESQSHICFSSMTHQSLQIYSCLPARSILEGKSCKNNYDCHDDDDVLSIDGNSKNTCVTPLSDNFTKLLSVKRHNKKNVVFFGNPMHILYSVSVSNYIPKFSFSPLHLPYMIETFAKYIISLSGALAVFNIVPCYALDGQWITIGIVNLIFRTTVSKYTRTIISNCIILAGTLLVAFNILLAFWILFVR